MKDLKPIYTAIDADSALVALESFEEKWGAQLPVIGQAWRERWEYVTPFMAYEPEVRRVIYTTNAIEAMNRQLRKALNTKGSFPSEDATRKLIYLAIQNAGTDGRRGGQNVPTAKECGPTGPRVCERVSRRGGVPLLLVDA